MPRAFANIAFTPSVKAAQRRNGSRESNAGFEGGAHESVQLGAPEREFIAARDSFYQSTVAENGWPYVQHRGGAAGFLQVLDEKTLGFADFSGNRQYLSIGNLAHNDRIALILMDYPNRRRLKVWGRVRLVDEQEAPELIARLEVPTYRARVERGFIISVEAFDWNCPQHITPRYSQVELDERIEPLRAQIKALSARLDPAQQATTKQAPLGRNPVASGLSPALGEGPLALVVAGVRQLTPRVRAYELRRVGGEPLPAIAAGAHLAVPVRLPDGTASRRNYSISSNPQRLDAWEIAVQREGTDGGSAFVHEQLCLGARLNCEEPRNHFRLHDDARPAVLIAAGIGITAIKSMALALDHSARPLHLHYAGRAASQMAYRDRLQRQLGERLSLYVGDAGQRLDLAAVVAGAPVDALFYACGPQRLLEELQEVMAGQGIGPERLRLERFGTDSAQPNRPFEITLERSKQRLRVSEQQSLLEALEQAGIAAPSGCRVGDCGSCKLSVLEGMPEHRDAVLTPEERIAGQLICSCVSRAESDHLVLDL
ncbi:2Fe-2S iron-sulfur cluster-binding protein [Aestuariirhabdus sp. LZHN29]|uniref:2Fe-2S iron-sulfur cluster-binding protein n=1 Tax=Aestuariirhabdus sp. LZHN29 TaxID=3417462 RepID=UPI003CE80343